MADELTIKAKESYTLALERLINFRTEFADKATPIVDLPDGSRIDYVTYEQMLQDQVDKARASYLRQLEVEAATNPWEIVTEFNV
jgi:hypothetical protein